jgi:hypothetical protein
MIASCHVYLHSCLFDLVGHVHYHRVRCVLCEGGWVSTGL